MDVLDQINAIIDRATQDFDGRDELLKRAATEIRRLRTLEDQPVRYAPATGETLKEMRDSIRDSKLYKYGDASLVWVNQGDINLRGSNTEGEENQILELLELIMTSSEESGSANTPELT